MVPPLFTTERMLVVPFTMGDLERFYLLNGDEEVMRYIRPAQSLEQSREFLQKIIDDYSKWPGMGRWMLLTRQDHRFIGTFCIIPVKDSDQIQLGYALIKSEWGRGYASESVRQGLVYAFEKLGLKEIAGITYAENVPSQKVLLKNGFVFNKSFLEEGNKLHLYVCCPNDHFEH